MIPFVIENLDSVQNFIFLMFFSLCFERKKRKSSDFDVERESYWLTPIPTTKTIVLGVIELHSMRKVPVGCYFTFKLREKVDMTLGSFWV